MGWLRLAVLIYVGIAGGVWFGLMFLPWHFGSANKFVTVTLIAVSWPYWGWKWFGGC